MRATYLRYHISELNINFARGLIMYYAVRETKNILVAFIIHGLHNALVILSTML